MFLTSQELLELTGYKSAKRQAKWLSENGFRFECRADGRPIVLKQQLVERQCGRSVGTSTQPDFSWMA